MALSQNAMIALNELNASGSTSHALYDVPVGGTISAPYKPSRFVDDDGRIFYASEMPISNGLTDIDHEKIGFDLNLDISSAYSTDFSSTGGENRWVFKKNDTDIMVLTWNSNATNHFDCRTYKTETFEKISTGEVLTPSEFTLTEVTTAATSNKPIYVEEVNGIIFVMGINKILYSSNDFGVTWKQASFTSISTLASINDTSVIIKVVYTGTRYLIYVPTTSLTVYKLYSSTDLTTWTAVTTPFSSPAMNLISFNNKILAISQLVSDGYYYSSDGGVTWSAKVQYFTDTTLADSLHHYKIYNNKLFLCGGIITGSTGNHFVTYTSDGITWTNITLVNNTIRPSIATEMIEFKQKLYIYIRSVVPNNLLGGLGANIQIFEYDDLTQTTRVIKIDNLNFIQGKFYGGSTSDFGSGVPIVQLQNVYGGDQNLGTVYYKGTTNLHFFKTYSDKLFVIVHGNTFGYILNESVGNFESNFGLLNNPDTCEKINNKFVISRGRDQIFFTDPTKFPYYFTPNLTNDSATHIRTK